MADDDLPDNPYPGLRPFRADETHLFFGRDEQRVELLRRLRQSRFLAIVGTSGSGKSSLVRAGLLPGLYGDFMAGPGSQWRIVDMRPGTDPIGNLARALDLPGALLDEAPPPDESFTEATLRRSALGLVQAVREARLPAGDRILVLVDQFEELFRAIEEAPHARAGDDAAAFVKLLLEAARQSEVPLFVVLTMRSDFLGECARFRDLPEAINDGQYLVPRLTRDQRREAITGPAAVHGVTLSSTLVNRLLNDVGENPDQLPILQHALMRTWDLWARGASRATELDLPDYEQIGGMDLALARHADGVLDALAAGPDAAAGLRRRRIAEQLFKALTASSAGGREVRRLAQVRDVAEVAGASVDEVLAVVEAFREPHNAFLMPPAGEPLGPDSSIDISHESLIRNWPQLRAWLAEEAEGVRIYAHLVATARMREGRGGDPMGQPELGIALAWRARQQPNQAWAARYDGPAFALAMDFLDDSQEHALARDARAALRRRRLAATLGLAFLAMLLGTLAWVFADLGRDAALSSETKSRLTRLQAKAEEAEQDADREIGRLLVAGDIDAASEKIGALDVGAALPWIYQFGVIADLHSSEIRKERGQLARFRASSEVQRKTGDWSWTHPVHRRIAGKLAAGQALNGHEYCLLEAYGQLLRAKVSTDASWGCRVRWLTRWDVGTGQAQVATLDERLAKVALLPTGRSLLTRDADGAWTLHDTASVAASVARPGTPVGDDLHGAASLTFSRDGRHMASWDALSGAMTMSIWDLANPKPRRIMRLPVTGTGGPLVFSADGSMLALSGNDRVRLFDTHSGNAIGESAQLDRPQDLAFAPDGRTLAVGTKDTVTLLDLPGLAPDGTLGHSRLQRVAFSADGATLATGSSDGTVAFWDVRKRLRFGEPMLAHRGAVTHLAFSPDGAMLASGGVDGKVLLWSTASHRRVGTALPQQGPVSDVAFSDNGALVTVAKLTLSFDTGFDSGNELEADAGWVYERMVVQARQRGSSDLAVQEFKDHAQFASAALALLSWPLWKLLRWRRRRSGQPAAVRPAALRRAFAALFDIAIATSIFVAAALLLEDAMRSLSMAERDLVAIPVGGLLGIAYLLLCDALALKYRRSIGKIVFDLRAVRLGGEHRAAIGPTVSAKRNALWAVAQPLVLAAVVLVFDGIGREFRDWALVFFVVVPLALPWLLYALPGLRDAAERRIGARVAAALRLATRWLVGDDGRTIGDRWSRTQVIDADSEESLRADVPERYLRPGTRTSARAT